MFTKQQKNWCLLYTIPLKSMHRWIRHSWMAKHAHLGNPSLIEIIQIKQINDRQAIKVLIASDILLTSDWKFRAQIYNQLQTVQKRTAETVPPLCNQCIKKKNECQQKNSNNNVFNIQYYQQLQLRTQGSLQMQSTQTTYCTNRWIFPQFTNCSALFLISINELVVAVSSK